MWIKLDADLGGAMSRHSYKPVLVNFDHVKKVTPGDTNGMSKIIFVGDETLRVSQSLTFIQGTLDGTLNTGYTAPDPKDP